MLMIKYVAIKDIKPPQAELTYSKPKSKFLLFFFSFIEQRTFVVFACILNVVGHAAQFFKRNLILNEIVFQYLLPEPGSLLPNDRAFQEIQNIQNERKNEDSFAYTYIYNLY